MLNNINTDNTDVKLSAQLVKQDSLNTILGTNSTSASKSTSSTDDIDSNFFIDSSDISKTAMKMYEKENDISKFTKLATSDPDNTSAEERVQNLFADGVTDPFEDSVLSTLSSNQSLLGDLGL